MRQVLLAPVLAVLLGCATPPGPRPAPAPVGALLAVTRLESKEVGALRELAGGFPGAIPVQSGAVLYKLTYSTRFKGTSVPATALAAVPASPRALRGTVLYLHGTTTSRAASPSRPERADGNEEAAVFAGGGYLVALPDYLGLGDSMLPQAFALVEPQVDASRALLVALQAFAAGLDRELPPALLLMGFSQGGQVAAGLHRSLEQAPVPGFDLKGTVAIAGPHDLLPLSVAKVTPPASADPFNIGFLAFAVAAYAGYYQVPLEGTFAAPYARTVPGLFDGEKAPRDILAGLPADARELFEPGFLRGLQSGADSWWRRRLEENETWRFVPRRPLRLVAGGEDGRVPLVAVRALYDHAHPLGGAVELVVLDQLDHDGAARASYAPARAWFDQLSGTATPR